MTTGKIVPPVVMDMISVDADRGLVIGKRGRPIGVINVRGYVAVTVHPVRNTFQAHRMIWQAINGPIPPGMEINHKNGIKHDNRISNLEVVTPSQNVLHANRTGLRNVKGSRNPSAKLNENSIKWIKEMFAAGLGHRAIANFYGMARSTIWAIGKGYGWQSCQIKQPTDTPKQYSRRK